MDYKYDYFEVVKSDISDYFRENYPDLADTFTLRDFSRLYDELLFADSVTGNSSGSYTFSAWRAAENVCHNEYLLDAALVKFYGSKVPVKVVTSPELCDVLIRCYVLSPCLSAFLVSKMNA